MLTDAEHLFMCFMAIFMISLEKGPFKSSAPICLGCFFVLKQHKFLCTETTTNMHKQFACFGEKFLVGISVCTY